MASRSSFWNMAPIRRSGISMGARRSTLPSIMRLVQHRPAVVAGVDALQAVKVLLVVEVASVARLVVEGAVVPLLVVEGPAVVLPVVVLGVVPAEGTEAVRWQRGLKCRARRSSTCCWLPA